MHARSFCYVDDLVDGLMRLMAAPRHRHRGGQSREPDRIHHMRPRQARDRRSRLYLQDDLSAFASRRLKAAQTTCNAGQKQLGREPRITLREGLKSIVAYFRDRI